MHASYDFLVVGAGFSGAVIAERLARVSGKRSLVIDRRTHIAGNAFDRYDDAGVLIHPYCPHYFRTNSDRVREYLSQFTEWQPVNYKILSYTDGRFWNFPINLNTFEQFIGRPIGASTTRTAQNSLNLRNRRFIIRNAAIQKC
jgi:UDP-galactopyranose mutase